MTTIHLLLALIVGISETCASNGNVVAGGAYAEAVRKAGDIPIVVCRTAKPENLDQVVSRLDLLIATGGEDVDPARYGETPSPHLGRFNAVRDEFEEQLLRAAVRHELPIVGTCRGMQHLNVFFGGTLHQDLPSELGARYTVEHRTGRDSQAARRDRRHPIEIVPGSRLALACGAETAAVNSLHHQMVSLRVYLADLSFDIVDIVFLHRSAVKLVKVLARGADIDIEYVHIDIGVFIPDKHGVLCGIHAAYL